MNNLPYMQRKDIDVLESYFKMYKPKIILEWGSGGSTVYFPKIFRFVKEWHALEHDLAWVNDVSKLVNSNVTVHYRPNYELDKIVEDTLSRADFVIVDGIYRGECLNYAAKLSKESALTFLHDSGRTAYRRWFDMFPNYKKLTDGRVPDGEGGFKRDGLHLFLHK